jgi:SAM-dependent methyltransferase
MPAVKNEYKCGCVIATDEGSGVLRSLAKCPEHSRVHRDPAGLDGGYYASLGVLTPEHRLAATRHVAELVEALGPIPSPTGCNLALEVGCGASPYVGAIREAGWVYAAVDPSSWASEWMRKAHDAPCHAVDFEDLAEDSPRGLILSAHSLEHMADSPEAIKKCARLLDFGGILLLVVPDDSDHFNPDHLWHYTPETLRSSLEAAGLIVEAVESRRIVPHENFLYARARKPAIEPGGGGVESYPGLDGHSWMFREELDWMIGRLPEFGLFLEIGTASGVTAAKVAEARPSLDVLCVDPFPDADAAHVRSIESARPDIWRRNRRPNMNLFVGTFGELRVLAPILRADAVLVDGGHLEDEVSEDLRDAAHSLYPGGTIFVHDYDDPAHYGVTAAVSGFLRDWGFRESGRCRGLIALTEG